jgi:hypothetical protein
MSKSSILILLLIIVAASPTIAGGLTDEERADLEWFEGLGFPDVSEAPYVRVQTGGWIQSGGRPREPIRVHAFLLGEEDDCFTVLGHDLRERTYRRKPDGPLKLERVDYERLDFAAEMRTRIVKRFVSGWDSVVAPMATGGPPGAASISSARQR